MKLPKPPTPLTSKEVASFYRVCEATVINWAKAETIPHMKRGYVYRFPNPEALQLCNPSERR